MAAPLETVSRLPTMAAATARKAMVMETREMKGSAVSAACSARSRCSLASKADTGGLRSSRTRRSLAGRAQLVAAAASGGGEFARLGPAAVDLDQAHRPDRHLVEGVDRD